MKIYLTAFVFITAFASCFNPLKKTVDGNSNIISKEKNLSAFTKVNCSGIIM